MASNSGQQKSEQSSIVKFAECISVASSCSRKCLQEGMIELSNLCLDCADIFTLVIKFHSRNSEFSKEILKLAEKIAAHCAEACEQIKTDHCHHCAKVCKECVNSCR